MRSAGPIRTCVGCRTRRAQGELLRFQRRRDGHVVFSLDRHVLAQGGRSAYVCPSQNCFDRAVRRRTLARSLAGPRGLTVHVPSDLWSSIFEATNTQMMLNTLNSAEEPRQREQAQPSRLDDVVTRPAQPAWCETGDSDG